jgi:hypothetical protein
VLRLFQRRVQKCLHHRRLCLTRPYRQSAWLWQHH